MSATGETTKREIETSRGSAQKRQLALHWVHPSPRADPLGTRSVVGRGEEAEIRIASEGASRAHVEIYRQGPIHVLRDLASTNGTFLNGERVAHAAVAVGDVLRVGSWVGVFAEGCDDAAAFGDFGLGLWGGHVLGAALAGTRDAAMHGLPILVVGATGTGKERVARAVHVYARRSGPFVAVNCAALAVNLAESELFGHVRGAFSGAASDRKGHLRSASTGTLFLDEIVELPLAIQAKLLRAVEERCVIPLGSSSALPIDVQLVSAAQQPLGELIRQGRFREDFAARLNGLQVVLPSLVERKTDVPRLFERFLYEHSGGRPPEVDAKLVERLCLHTWPQNVRELEMLARRLIARYGHERVLRRSHLPAELTEAGSAPPAMPLPSRRDQDLEKLTQALRSCSGNVKLAAEKAGFSRQRAYRLLGNRSASELLAEIEDVGNHAQRSLANDN
jgi:hypothetical protein